MELKRRWTKTESLLLDAFKLLREEETLLPDLHYEFEEYIASNELGLALDVLLEIGLQADIQLSEYWKNLAQAACIMLR